MKILFVSSGNSEKGITPIVFNQGESLKMIGLEIEYFLIDSKGILGYLKNSFRLRKYLQSNNFDIIHAHYLFSGLTASLAGSKKLVVSLMGSDIMQNTSFLPVVRLCSILFHWKIIVKTKEMDHLLRMKNVSIIPNGVNIEKFIPLPTFDCKVLLNWDIRKKHILFAAAKDRVEKNYSLLQSAIELLHTENIEIHSLENIRNEEMPNYYNAADVVVLTSLREGSPNVIKEAMACNRPIVCTNVGDAENLISTINGCHICSFDPTDIASKIKNAIEFAEANNKNTARQKLIELELDSESVAKKIINIYEKKLMRQKQKSNLVSHSL